LNAYKDEFGLAGAYLLPANLYGPYDDFDLETSHVIPALIRKFHDAKESAEEEVVVWGSGTPRREFLHVDDLADACLFLMQSYDGEGIVNVGCGEDLTIAELAERVSDAVGFEKRIVFDASKPDGTPRKLLDVSRLTALGWRPKVALRDGLAETYRWYVLNRPR